MPEAQRETPDIRKYLASLGLPDFEIGKKVAKHAKSEKVIASFGTKETEVFFVRYDEEAGGYVDLASTLKSISFPNDFDFTTVLYERKLDLSYRSNLSDLLGLGSKKIKKIKIVKKAGELRNFSGVLHIGTDKLEKVLKVAKRIYTKSQSHRTSIRRYLINQELINFNGKPVKAMTSTEKGEMKFTVDRLNIAKKSKKADFTKYLNLSDIQALQNLCEKLVKFEVFEEGFIRGLDEYFIKAKLKEIIELGREILTLGKVDLNTEKAKAVIEKLREDKKDIKQLETVWQVYFEKYLLYLIFSYRKIYPKVELKVETGKRFPDFLGINHYFGVDVIEIKHHLLPALIWDSSHRNFAFSGDLSKAIIQVTNYMDALVQNKIQSDAMETEIRDELKKFIFENNIYRPRAIIIISSSDKLAKERGKVDLNESMKRDFTKLRNSLHNIEILTFDEILNTAEYYSNNIFS